MHLHPPITATTLTLTGCLWLTLSLAPAVHGQSAVHYTFEDGITRGAGTRMKVLPRIMTEDGNRFMRITASPGDKTSIPGRMPTKNRSTVTFTASHMKMPLLSDANRHQTYSMDVRFHENTGSDGTILQMFQGAPGGESGGYGTRNGTGPVVRFFRTGTTITGHANYANETKSTPFTMGTAPAGRWHNLMIKAVWSNKSSEGRVEVYLDGKLKKTITGRESNLGPKSNRLPALVIGMYGAHATGVIDIDNVKAGPSGAGTPPPPPQPPPPVPPAAPTEFLISQR